MASTNKTNGEGTKKRLAVACKILKCTEDEFRLAVSTVIRNEGFEPCLAGDTDCVSAQVLPYIKAVLAGTQKRLPLQYIARRGDVPRRTRPPAHLPSSARASALASTRRH